MQAQLNADDDESRYLGAWQHTSVPHRDTPAAAPARSAAWWESDGMHACAARMVHVPARIKKLLGSSQVKGTPGRVEGSDGRKRRGGSSRRPGESKVG